MIVSLLRTWGVWFLAVQLVVKAEVTFENGAYRNLVVSLSSNLPVDERENIVKQTTDLLKKTAVFLETLGVPFRGQVSIVLPDNWDVSSYNPESIPPVQPDFLVDNREGSPFGKGPFAEQYGGCGVQGTHVDVPYSFLTSKESYPKAKLLAREWLKFRYGVFDEHGFPGDSKYPDHYTVPGDDENVKITECTDPAVEYLIKNSNNETCSLDEEDCKIHLGEGAEEVKSSLMYLHEELINVDQVCGEDHSHNFMSPSKQNILCNEKSIWEVLNESVEFKNPEPSTEAGLKFKYVKFSKPKMFILFEATSALKEKKDEIIFALRRVMYDLPEGAHLGLGSFIHTGDSYGEIRPLSELGEDRNLLITKTFDAPSDGVCPLCALEKAIDVFSENEPGLIILIAASNSTRSESENNVLLERLKKSHLFLQLIAISDDGISLSGYSDFLTQLTHLNKAQLSEISNKADLFQELYLNILSRFPFSSTDTEIKIVTGGTISKSEDLRIQEDSLNETVTIWMNRKPETGQIQCKNGIDDVILTYMNDQHFTRATFNTEGLVICKLSYGDPIMVQVTKPKPTESGDFLSASTWVHDTTPKQELQQADSKVQMPVIIFAKINYGNYPVYDAKVESVVKDDEGSEGTVFLKDDGKGDPDITKGDGIYSGYFFEFNKEGPYNVEVNIKTDPSTTAIKIGNDRCCGSQVEPKEPLEESIMTVPVFEKSVSTVFSAVSSKPETGYPPAKILDLRVTKFEPPSLLELSWTAPGGEVDQGIASTYTLKSFTNRKEAVEKFDSAGQQITITKNPSSPGTDEVLTLQLNGLLDDNMTHFLTLRADGKTPGQPSNVVTVSVPEASIFTEPPQPTEEPVKKASGPNSKTIAIVIGVLVGVIVISICVYLAIYCIGKKKAKAKDEQRKAEEGSVRNGGGMGMNSIPADAILRHHSEVVKAKRDHKDPPIFTEEDATTTRRQESDYSQVQKDPPELPTTAPPKSPKRMTVV